MSSVNVISSNDYKLGMKTFNQFFKNVTDGEEIVICRIMKMMMNAVCNRGLVKSYKRGP